MNIEYHHPEHLKFDTKGHVRSNPEQASDKLVRNIKQVGKIVEPIHARRVENELVVFDGWRRVKACDNLDMKVPIIVYDNLDTKDAFVKSLKLNDSEAGIIKSVTQDDREKSLMKLVTGESRNLNKWESDEEIHEARYKLGLDGEEEALNRIIGHIRGVGEETVSSLIKSFNDAETVLKSDEKDLKKVKGIGDSKASLISECTY